MFVGLGHPRLAKVADVFQDSRIHQNGSCWFVFVFVGFMEEQKMKVLHVITSLRTGGAEKLMVDLLPRMKQKGYEVD